MTQLNESYKVKHCTILIITRSLYVYFRRPFFAPPNYGNHEFSLLANGVNSLTIYDSKLPAAYWLIVHLRIQGHHLFRPMVYRSPWNQLVAPWLKRANFAVSFFQQFFSLAPCTDTLYRILGTEFLVPFSSHSRSLAMKSSSKSHQMTTLFDQNEKFH